MRTFIVLSQVSCRQIGSYSRSPILKKMIRERFMKNFEILMQLRKRLGPFKTAYPFQWLAHIPWY